MSKNPDEVGAAWIKKDKNGADYLFIQLELDGEKRGFSAFKNKYKQADKHPDYVVLRSRPKSEPAPIPSVLPDEGAPF